MNDHQTSAAAGQLVGELERSLAMSYGSTEQHRSNIIVTEYQHT